MDIQDALKKCNTDKELYKFLYKIRTNSINSEAAIEKFSQKGVKALSVLLSQRIELKTSSENDKIIEIILSILGNCTCYNKKAANEAYESSITDTVISIVNTTYDPSIQSKGCRLIGNLAQIDKIAASLQHSGVALCLSNCIAEDSNIQVLTMSIRAMRLMWNLKRFRHQILNYGTILKVVMCLYKILKCESEEIEEEVVESKFVVLKRQSEPDRRISKEKLEKIIEREMELATQTNYEFMAAEKKKKVEFCVKKENSEVINGILKFILTIVNSSLPQVARSVFADGFGIKILIFLTSEVKYRSMALKILSSFAYNSTTQEFLRCSSDVVAEICDLLLKNFQTLAASEQKYALAIVCLNSESSCVRLKLRRSGIFKIMLEIAATTKSEEELNLLIFSFFQFRFDEVGLEDLMRLNLVNVMIKITSDLIAKMDIDHIANDDPSVEDEKPLPSTRKRLNTEPLNYPYAVKYPRFDNPRPASPIGSPTSTSSGYGGSYHQMSPTTSGYSPFNSPVRCYHDYDSDSNQYSPVCSDNEEDLDRMEAKVMQIIERKKNEGNKESFEGEDISGNNFIKSPRKFGSLSKSTSNIKNYDKSDSKLDSKTYNNETQNYDQNHEDDYEQSEQVKDEFNILDFIYNNEEIGKSSDGAIKSKSKEKVGENSKSSKKAQKTSKNKTKKEKSIKESKNVEKLLKASKSLSEVVGESQASIQFDEENSLTTNEESFPSINDQSDNEDSKTSTEPQKSSKPDNFPETLQKIEEDKLQFILQLLWKVSLKYSDAPAFVQSKNLQTLINVCHLVKKPNGKIYQILQNVVEQTRNFVAIFLKQNLVFDIFGLSRTEKHENCYSCDKMKMISRQLLIDFAKVGESGYGQGEIIHSLITSDLDFKKKIAVKLLYIVRCPEMLNKLLFDYRALDIVLSVIFNNEELSVNACDGLTIMAENLNIKIPSDDETLNKIIPDDFVELKETKSDCEKIKFIVSDGEILLDKKILIESSEVFTSMLSSGFRESKFNEIHFSTYTVKGVKYFHQLLAMQKLGKLKSIAPKVDDIEILLHSFELSNLYIILEIQQPLLNVIKIVIDETNVMKVFEWSLRNVNQELLISSICYFLCAKIDGEKKLKLFIEANESKYSEEWKRLIIDSITMKCRVVE